VLLSRKTRRAIKFPRRQKRVMIAIEQCAPDVLTKDTAVLIFNKKMLPEA
jgi:hypothetical protein